MKTTAYPRESSTPHFLLAPAAFLAVSLITARAAATPKVGEPAANFTLNTLQDKPVQLSQKPQSLSSVGSGCRRLPFLGPSKAIPAGREQGVPSLLFITTTPLRQP